ncbi:hypothetical protein N7448_004108 [Penicillium atrosanguineum]|uniref:Uncharacterized protein n=1 Tax=Penicillium atrosanguineum TaxID=1132637 RepID=A0A9W9Q0D3_9EURO|nr:uncharacterized protein N7443_003072 [Penicillium atrosanguineum]KAJ5140700.1 hypothetical protein N7448_004108 [Penicillium atrosanguineum]KAJ5310611.1 hypothetical protein N7443_003072 [Penicillium atrosanguineum]KAJ5316133.1 hypothetical protein N7476_006440 [Penicillium atrosanguineum]
MSENIEVRQAEAAEYSSSVAGSSSSVVSSSSSVAGSSSSSALPSAESPSSSSIAAGDSTSAASAAAATTTIQDAGATLITTTKPSALIPTATVQSSSRTPSSTPSVPNVTSSKFSSSASQKGSYSSGTLAGAIVGSIAGTCLIALLAFFYLRRRKGKIARGTTRSSTTDTSEIPKHPGTIQSRFLGTTAAVPYEKHTPVPPAIGSQLFDLASYIPSPADDSAVCMRIQTLFDQASLHIDNYYSRPNPTVRLTPNAIVSLNKFDSPFLPSPLATLLSNPRSQRPALTHALVRALLHAIQPGSQTGSLLPPCFSMSPKKQLSGGIDSDDYQAMFAWRMLTASMFTRSRDVQRPISVVPQGVAITALAESFNTAFAPYSDPHLSEAGRLGHLQSVVEATAELGAWLFAQPCSFEFRWTPLVTPLNQVIVSPAVVKVGDEQGRALSVPHTLVEETLARI